MKSSRGSNRPDPLALEHIIGHTALNGCGLVGSSTGNDIFYTAGCVVVRYNHFTKQQKRFYHTSKPISCIALSSDGRYLAAGERGHLPSIVIWDMLKDEKVAALQGHKHGVGCLAFSPNSRYLVSVGFKPDKQLILWGWQHDKKLVTQKLSNKVHSVSFHHSSAFFVTAGDRHLKWWMLDEVLEGEAVSLTGQPASITEEHRLSVFMDVVCGNHNMDGKVFVCSAAGVLLVFNESRFMERTVQLAASPAYSLEVFTADGAPGLLVVGCGDGSVLACSPHTLEQLAVLPHPSPLHKSGHQYPACYAVRKVPGSRADPVPKLATIFADRSLFVWDISDIPNASIIASLIAHRSCVWDAQFIDSSVAVQNASGLPAGAFFTCSADNTVRCWAGGSEHHTLSGAQADHHNVHSDEMLYALEVDSQEDADTSMAAEDGSTIIGMSITQGVQGIVGFDFSRGMPDTEIPDRPQSAYSPRSLAIHPFGYELACGDKTGHLRIYDLQSLQLIRSVQAHSSEILTLAYSPPLISMGDGYGLYAECGEEDRQDDAVVLLATAGRDRLIHIFQADRNYSPVDTLDHHSSSVIVVKFTCDGKKLISCSGDKTMVFCTVNGPVISRIKSISTPQGTINGLAVDPSNKFAVSSGQDKRLSIWNVHSGKLMRTYKNPEITSELYKSDLDPSGSYIATCGFDKMVTLVDFFSGEVIAQVAGHSELVTGVRFSADGLRLLTIGGDGLIMVWRVADLLVKAMKDRLVELYSSAQKRNARAVVRQQSIGAAHVSADQLPEVPPAASLSHLKQKVLSRHGSGEVARPPAQGASDHHRHKWDAQEGYELFGRKVVPGHDAHKLTLELTTAALAEHTMHPLPPQPPTEEEEQQISNTSAANLTEGQRQATDAEDLDGVMHGMSSDEEDSALFAPVDDDTPSPPRPTSSPSTKPMDDEDDIVRAKEHISSLQKSAHDLNNWLEDVLRSESELPSASKGAASAGPALDQSLSSAFFRGVRTSQAPSSTASTEVTPAAVVSHAILPPPPPLPSMEEGTPPDLQNERKLRESAAMMVQMREKLRVMDAHAVPEQEETSQLPDEVEYDRTHSTISSDELNLRQEELTTKSAEQILAEKTRSYHSVLKELQMAKEKAAASLQELLQLRTSLENSVDLRDPNLHASMSLQETDALLDQFRRSLASFNDLPLQLTAGPGMRTMDTGTSRSSSLSPRLTMSNTQASASGKATDEDHVLAQFLERYSDRLVDLVGEKMLNKAKP